MDIFLKLHEMEEQLTKSEQKIAQCILDNSEEIYNYSIKEFAKECNTSPASIVRFCHKLGYDGFQEFKINLIKNVTNSQYKENNIYEDVSVEDDIEDIINKITMINIKSIENTKTLLDRKQLEKAINSLDEAKNIYLFGVGASGLVAMDFQHKLMRINKKAFMYLDSHSQLASAVNIEKGDVAVGISHSGKTLEVLKAIMAANEKGARTISITKYGNNPVSSAADIKLWVGDIEKNLRIGAIASRIAQLTLIDILLIGLSKKNFEVVSKIRMDSSLIVKDLKVK